MKRVAVKDLRIGGETKKGRFRAMRQRAAFLPRHLLNCFHQSLQELVILANNYFGKQKKTRRVVVRSYWYM